jgi:phosphotransferase system enzyme I (PtsI)
MARSLGIPSLAGLPNITSRIRNGNILILDGYRGILIVNPEGKTLSEYEQYINEKNRINESLEVIRDESGITLDNVHIAISANIKHPSDMPDVKKSGAEGVGLFRSEFLFLGREDLPDEEEQYIHYCDVAEKSLPHSVIIRTVDIGGDKVAQSMDLPKEDYPILGLRAIRLCLERPAIFKPQLRAILRAATKGNIRLMFPMISSLTEFREARAVLEECKVELRSENKPFNEKTEIGVMIEVPSAALTSDLLAKEVNFFSIGTNDLIQYTIALDRLNNRVAHLYEPTHPAVLRLIRQVVEAGRNNGIWTGTCGEAASDLILIPLLVGLGVSELSVSPMLIPHVKKAIQSVSLMDCQRLAEQSLQATVSSEILDLCAAFARQRFGELL